MALLKNTDKAPFEDRFAGKDYAIKPGKTADVPDAAADHWLGRQGLSGADAREEARRVGTRWGGQTPTIERVEPESLSGDGNGSS